MKNNIFILLLPLFGIGYEQKLKQELTVNDIRIFKNTAAWNLVQAVDKNDTYKIQIILNNRPELIDFQEPYFGTTALMWAICSEKYLPAKVLLENGANPNIISTTGTTALFGAISFGWNETMAKKDENFVKLLLDYKANPNINYCAPITEGEISPIECGTSPLIHSISRGFEKVKLLVESGADINYKTKSGNNAAYEALLMKDIEAAYFLIVEHNAKITEPVYSYSLDNADTLDQNKMHYPVDLLLDWTMEINSSDYQKKKQIIAEFMNQGIDYESRKDNISKIILRKIKKIHPKDWKEYIYEY